MRKVNEATIISIAFAINDDYVDQLGVTILSILLSNPAHTFDFIVFSSDISDGGIKKLKNIHKDSKKYQLRFIKVDDSLFNGFPVRIRHITRETYYRYLLPDLLPNQDRVLYLDADLLVLGDIAELWNLDIEQHFVAGSNKEYISIQFPGYKQSLGLDEDETYVNAGVLLFNLELIRKHDKVRMLFENTERLKDIIKIQDQDVINITFKGAIKSFSNKYNYTTRDRLEKSRSNKDVVIVHFNTSNKPWEKDYKQTEDDTYFVELYKEYQCRYQIISMDV